MDFEKQYFEQLTKQITDLQGTIVTLTKKVDDIQAKVIYMYGFAAAIGFVASFVIEWVRSAFTLHVQ